jgi:hypothetical protein
MRPAAIVFAFRFSSRPHSLAPLTLRNPNAVTASAVSERMFSHGTQPQDSSSGPEASRHSETAQPCPHENDSRCLRHQQWRATNTSQDQGAGRSPFMDAALATVMGIGIGELQF